MQATRLKYKWKAKCFDIKQAYCWAESELGQLIALKYPKGFERYGEHGEPLYMVCRKNLYGHPAASRNWSRTRDEFILKYFNTGEWSCHKCVMDPSMFYLTRDQLIGNGSDGKNAETIHSEAMMIMNTDDCDMIGSNDSILQAILDACHAEWEVKGS